MIASASTKRRYGNRWTPKRLLGFALLFNILAGASTAHAKNFVRYHQRCLVVQEYMMHGDTSKALALLNELEERYGLMPTETFARALCQVALGDTAAARLSYLKSIEQHAPFGWLFFSAPVFRSAADSLWYESVIADCTLLRRSLPQYADGPNEGMPTPVTRLNRRHQFIIDSLGYFDPAEKPEAQQVYDAIIIEHDLTFDSLLTGKLKVPSIAIYGVNEEFETFLLHVSAPLKVREHRTVRRWLERGMIYPCTYAVCFDDLANEEHRPIPYGIFSGLRPEEREPGHEERRAAIGMGDELLEKLRFHRGG